MIHGLYADYQAQKIQEIQQGQKQERRRKQKKLDAALARTLNCIGGAVRLLCSVLIYLLAAVGLICLTAAQFYPEMKEGLFRIWDGLLEQINIVLNF